MNVLDNHITDLDNRIKDICKTAPSVEESSIQESLSSYGWILLDSWIAWRTLRFLLKDQDVNHEIQKKWFQTPSSFSASQIRAVWHFGDNIDSYLGSHNLKNLKFIIDDEIEKNRNSSAHFSTGGIINGNDYQKIDKYYKVFSNIFLLYEIFAFYLSITNILLNRKDSELVILDNNKNPIFEYSKKDDIIDNFNFCIVDLNEAVTIEIHYKKDEFERFLCFDKDGCYFNNDLGTRIETYKIFSNKGYYRDLSLLREKLRVFEDETLSSK